MDAMTGAEAYASADDTGLPADGAGYRAFLEAKIKISAPAGLPCALDDVPTHLADGRPIRDHQRHLVRWAVEGGQRAIFAAFGLGKSIMQLLICDIILDKVEADPARDPAALNMGLIVAPLGVRREFIADARKLGLTLRFVQSDAEIDEIGDVAGLYLTNYESVRDGKIDPSRFIVTSLDEASVLRSYGSKTFQTFLPLFAKVRDRFAPMRQRHDDMRQRVEAEIAAGARPSPFRSSPPRYVSPLPPFTGRTETQPKPSAPTIIAPVIINEPSYSPPPSYSSDSSSSWGSSDSGSSSSCDFGSSSSGFDSGGGDFGGGGSDSSW